MNRKKEIISYTTWLGSYSIVMFYYVASMDFIGHLNSFLFYIVTLFSGYILGFSTIKFTTENEYKNIIITLNRIAISLVLTPLCVVIYYLTIVNIEIFITIPMKAASNIAEPLYIIIFSVFSILFMNNRIYNKLFENNIIRFIFSFSMLTFLILFFLFKSTIPLANFDILKSILISVLLLGLFSIFLYRKYDIYKKLKIFIYFKIVIIFLVCYYLVGYLSNLFRIYTTFIDFRLLIVNQNLLLIFTPVFFSYLFLTNNNIEKLSLAKKANNIKSEL